MARDLIPLILVKHCHLNMLLVNSVDSDNDAIRTSIGFDSRVTEFSVRTEQPLWILCLIYINFEKLHLSLELCYFVNLMLKYLYLRPRNERFGPCL